MTLTNAYLITTKNLEGFLNAIKSAKAPERVNNTFLTHLDYTSSNDRLFIAVLKGLGFLDETGVPTKRYFEFLDQTQSGRVLAQAIREAYADLFAVNTKAQEMSMEEVKNKFRTLTQGQKSDNVLGLMANTFKALSDLADWDAGPVQIQEVKEKPIVQAIKEHRLPGPKTAEGAVVGAFSQLHYNIQIHLPESRDPAVFEAIFTALGEHLP